MEDHDFNGETFIAATGAALIYAFADESQVRNGLDTRIRVYADNRSVGVYKPGARINFAQRPTQFRIVPIAPTLKGSILLGDGNVNTGQVQGLLTIVSAEAQRVMQGLSFWGAATVTAAAARFPFVGLSPAVVGGKRCAITSLRITSSVTQTVRVYSSFPGTVDPGVIGVAPALKAISGGISQTPGLLSVAADLAAAHGALHMAELQLTAGVPWQIQMERPIVLCDSAGRLGFGGLTAASTLGIAWEHDEL